MNNDHSVRKATRKGKRFRVSIPHEIAEKAGFSGNVFWVEVVAKDGSIVLGPTKEPHKESTKKDNVKKV